MGKMYKRFQDLTGHEAGIIEYESGETLICINWSHDDGIPRMFVTGLIGLKKFMNQHEKENSDRVYINGFKVWEVTCGEETLIFDTKEMWH